MDPHERWSDVLPETKNTLEPISKTKLHLKNVTSLCVNYFYILKPILIIFGTPYAETTDFETHVKFSTSP